MSGAFADCLPGRRCGLSRQAFYQRDSHTLRAVSQSMLVVDLVLALRREIPGLGTRKLHLLLGEPLGKSGIKLGRDKLHKILQDHDLILRQRRQTPKTTDSTHRLYIDKQKMKEYGVKGYLEKPISETALLILIQQIL